MAILLWKMQLMFTVRNKCTLLAHRDELTFISKSLLIAYNQKSSNSKISSLRTFSFLLWENKVTVD